MPKLTVIEAARAGFAARATIYRKLKEGALSFESDENGATVVDAAELTRVFGEPSPHRKPSHEAMSDTSETARLRAENALLRAENADLRLHRDRLMALIERTALAPPPAPQRRFPWRLFSPRPRSEAPR